MRLDDNKFFHVNFLALKDSALDVFESRKAGLKDDGRDSWFYLWASLFYQN